MATKSLEEVRGERADAIEANRDRGVIKWGNRQKLSDQVWEVTEGLKHVPDGKGGTLTLVPGNRFHPTEDQVRQTTEEKRGGLLNKARELTRSEYAGLRSTRKVMATGADIGLRSIPMADTTLQLALRAGLREEDFEGLEPTESGRYTRAQVQELIDRREALEP